MILGQKIRQKRLERSMSLTELAEKIERTPSFLSQIERGLAEPSITSLRKISDALSVPIFYFLLDTQENNPVVKRNERKILNFPESHLTFELISPDLNRKMEIMQAVLEPGASTCEEPLAHPGEECMLVVQGRMKVQIGEEEYFLDEGDSIYYFSMIPHKVTSVGEKDLIWISAMTPPAF